MSQRRRDCGFISTTVSYKNITVDLSSYQQYVQGIGYNKTQAQALIARHIRKLSAWATCTFVSENVGFDLHI